MRVRRQRSEIQNSSIEGLENRCLFSAVVVNSYGAIGNGSYDSTAAIQKAIDASAMGDTIYFGAGTYLISKTLSLKSTRNYIGVSGSVLLMSPTAATGTAMMALNAGQDHDVTVRGLTFNANDVGGGLQISVNGGNSTPAKNMNIVGNTFENTFWSNAHPYESAIYDPVGMQNILISKNTFIHDGGGICATDPNQLRITSNVFNSISGDAIFIPIFQAPFNYGSGIVVSSNVGQDIHRMAIELWGGGGNDPVAPLILRNQFTGFPAPPPGSDTFGMSIVTGNGAQIIGNIIRGGSSGLGIEVGGSNALVENNIVDGFNQNMGIGGAPGAIIRGNTLLNARVSGILKYNAGTAPGLQILDNRIINPHDVGIFMDATDGWAGAIIEGNTITRNGGVWTDDNGLVFSAMGLCPPGGAVIIENNTLIQGAKNVPAKFNFIGVRVNGYQENFAGSEIQGNDVISKSATLFGVGIFGNAPGALDQVDVSNNSYQGLLSGMV